MNQTPSLALELETIPTPALLLDLHRVNRNARRLTERVRVLGVRLRPHIKTHKCLELARIQTAGHFGGITVSNLAEARVFAANGFSDITDAVPIEPGKFQAVIDLTRTCDRFSVITDDLDLPELLNQAARKAGITIRVFVEVDSGDHRCGVDPHSDAALRLVEQLAEASHLDLAGILTHAGHSYQSRTPSESQSIAQQERDIMVNLAHKARRRGLEIGTISIGSTPTIVHADHLDGIDEVRPGNSIFFDAFQVAHHNCQVDDCALTVLAAVIHRDVHQRKIVIDAGAIALSKDQGACDLDAQSGYGRVCDLDGNDLGLVVTSVSQEHGKIHHVPEPLLHQLKVGTRVRVLANHSCLTAAQHTCYHILEDCTVIDRWKIHQGWA